MATQIHSIVTVAGRNKLALKTASNEAVVFAEIALGDGDRFPGGGETELEHEVFRGAITNSGTETGQPDAVWFDLYIAQEVPTFHAREIGLFDEDGVLYAVSRFASPVPKFGPDSANLSDNTFRIVVVFSATENIVVETSPVLGLTPDRKITTSTGLAGGGDLSTDRTFVTDWSNLVPLNAQISGSATLNMRQGDDQITISMSGLLAWVRGLLDNDGDDLTHDFVTFEDLATADDAGIVKLSQLSALIPGLLTYTELLAADPSTVNKRVNQDTLAGFISLLKTPNSYGYGQDALGNNTGETSNAFGAAALFKNTGDYSNGFGQSALRHNTGDYSSGFGQSSLYYNTGTQSNGVGHAALYNNTGVASNGFGFLALFNNAGAHSNGVGLAALYNNTGAYAAGFGYSALRNNTSPFAIAIGHEAGNQYVPGPARPVTASTGAQLTIPNHGFGGNDKYIVVRIESATTNPVGLAVGAIHRSQIIDANTIEIKAVNVSDIGVDLMVTQQVANFTNSTMLGYNAQAAGPNEIRLGNGNIEHVRTDGTLRTSKGVQSGTYQFAALPAPATMGKGARIWTDANMMLVSTGLKWVPIGQQIWAAHDEMTSFGFASVSVAVVGAEQIKTYVFETPVPNAQYIIHSDSGSTAHALTVVEKTTTGFKLVVGSDTSAYLDNYNVLVIWTGREDAFTPPDTVTVYTPPTGGGGNVYYYPDTEGFGGNDP